jgi:hypothetical protein
MVKRKTPPKIKRLSVSAIERNAFILSQSLLRNSLVSIVQGVPDLNTYFKSGRGFKRNIDKFMDLALKGNESSFLPGFTIRISQNTTLNQAMKKLAGALRSQQKIYMAYARVSFGVSTGNLKQLEYAKKLSEEHLKQSVQAGLLARAIASAHGVEIGAVYSTANFRLYVASLGTQNEITAQRVTKMFKVDKNQLKQATRSFDKTLRKLGKDLRNRFTKAIESARTSFQITTLAAKPVPNNKLKAGLAIMGQRIREKQARERAKEEEDRQRKKRKKEREERSAKKTTKKKKKKKT